MSDGKKKPTNGLPAIQQIDQAIELALKDIVTPAQQKQVLERLKPKLEIIAVAQKYHSGPLPSVETAQGYEAVVPGSFERILAMAEKDQTAVIDSHVYASRSGSWYRLLCMIFGFLALLAILGSTIFLAMNNHDNAAIAVAGLGVAGVVSAFVNARHSKS